MKRSSDSDHDFKTRLMAYYHEHVVDENDPPFVDELHAPPVTWITPVELFNLLNQETSQNYSKLSDPNYLLLLDIRKLDEFNQSHLITARHVKMDPQGAIQMPYGSNVECKQHIVVYDTFLAYPDETAAAYRCANMMFQNGSRSSVKILRGGYAAFCERYPDFRTTQIMYTPQELDEILTFPNEIVPRKLYLGHMNHARSPWVHKDLKIKAHVNCSIEPYDPYFAEDYPWAFQVAMNEYDKEDMMDLFPVVSDFIESCFLENKIVLVFSTRGTSISVAVVIAYLMKDQKYTLQKAYKLVKQCRTNANPTLHYMQQLAKWENMCFPERQSETDVEQLQFMTP